MPARQILALNRDDVYDARSPILLNAAATKLIFVAGLQGTTGYDLPKAIARWVTLDETAENRSQRDDAAWQSSSSSSGRSSIKMR